MARFIQIAGVTGTWLFGRTIANLKNYQEIINPKVIHSAVIVFMKLTENA
jgi:hypothetical protein